MEKPLINLYSYKTPSHNKVVWKEEARELKSMIEGGEGTLFNTFMDRLLL